MTVNKYKQAKMAKDMLVRIKVSQDQAIRLPKGKPVVQPLTPKQSKSVYYTRRDK